MKELLIFMLTLAIRNLKRRKFRSALTTLGIIVATTTIVSITTVGLGMQMQVTQLINELVGAGLIIGNIMGGGPPSIPEYVVSYVQRIDGVKTAVPVVSFMAEIRGELEQIYGVRPSQADIAFHPMIKSGRSMEDTEHSSAVISYDMAEKLGIKVGDTIVIQPVGMESKESFKIVGILESIGSGTFMSGCFITIESAQKLLGREGYVSMILIMLEDPSYVDSVEWTIKAMFPQARVMRQEKLLEYANQIIGLISAVLVAIGSISLAVGALGVTNTMMMSVHERTREIGIMKAIGSEKYHILLLFLLETAIMGLLGGCIGTTLGIIAVYAARNIITKMVGLSIPIIISPQVILEGLGTAVGVSMVAGLYPSWRAASLKPVEAIKYE